MQQMMRSSEMPMPWPRPSCCSCERTAACCCGKEMMAGWRLVLGDGDFVTATLVLDDTETLGKRVTFAKMHL